MIVSSSGHILVVEDDRLQAEMTAHILKLDGYSVDIADTAAGGLVSAQSVPRPDLMLIDVVLPDLNGTEVVRRLRALSTVPIILLTAKRQLADKLVGFDAGADDFVTKPFEPPELLARVRALLRRQRFATQTDEPTRFEIGDMVINTATHQVTLRGQTLRLTQREFGLLSLLAGALGRVVTRPELIDRIWGREFFGDKGALDVYVRRVRMKIEADSAHPRYLHTIRGTGFRLADEHLDTDDIQKLV